eukprot:gb/GECG01009213.1/.p1 GENE.gb/GECG01009213.1/~~gb/GECG01009213.1/.p1  ORF type:complete len:814 (+),score=117.73 gb/GECG01009213.1/:1-2442(+)
MTARDDSSIWTKSVDYDDGTPALRFASDGSGEAYYHNDTYSQLLENQRGTSIPGNKELRAVAVRVISYHASSRSRKQFQHTVYDVPGNESLHSAVSNSRRQRVIKLTGKLLANFNEHNVGFASESSPKEEEEEDQRSKRKLQFLSITNRGGQLSDETSKKILHSWLWNAEKKDAGTVPQEVTFDLNPYVNFRFFDGALLEIYFACNNREYLFKVGSITQSKLRYPGASYPAAEQPAEGESKQLSGRQSIPPEGKLQGLLNSLQDSVVALDRRKGGKSSKELREEALNQTTREVPSILRANLRGEQKDDTQSLKDYSDNIENVEDGYGTFAGASYHKGKWLGRVEVRQKLEGIHPKLPRSEALQRNSGKTTESMSSLSRVSPGLRSFLNAHQKVPRIAPTRLREYVESAPQDKIIIAACIREDEPLCRKAIQLLEHVLATLCIMYPFSSEFKDQTFLLTEEDQSVLADMALAARGQESGSAAGECPYRIVGVDMAYDKQAAKELNVLSLPYYFMFCSGQVVYRGVMGGTDRIVLPVCNRKVNVLALEPQSTHQIETDKAAHAAGAPCVLAGGTFNRKLERNTGIADEAIKRIENQMKLTESTRKRQSNSNSKSGSGQVAAGCDATSQLAGDFSIILLDANPQKGVDEESIPPLKNALERAADRIGRAVHHSHLAGHSLLVAVLERGTVMPGKSSWKANSYDAILYGKHHKKLKTSQQQSSLTAAKHVLTRYASRGSLSSATSEGKSPEEDTDDGSWTVRTPEQDVAWVCPRTVSAMSRFHMHPYTFFIAPLSIRRELFKILSENIHSMDKRLSQ